MAIYEFKDFRKILKGAICNRTQAQFANEAGISAAHLNRMLNDDRIHRPTKSTLLKIASVAKNGITYQDLEQALDRENNAVQGSGMSFHKLKEAIDDFTPDFEERVDITMKEFAEYVKNFPYPCIDLKPSIYINNVMEHFEPSPDALDVSYSIGMQRDYFGHSHNDSKKYIPVDLSMADGKYGNCAESTMLVYFTPIGDSHVAIQDVSVSMYDYVDLYGIPSDLIHEYNIDCPDNNNGMDKILALPYYAKIMPMQKFQESYKGDNILETIFGKAYRYPETICGCGFYIDNEPPKTFPSFVEKHLNSILSLYEDEPNEYKNAQHLILKALNTVGNTECKNKSLVEAFNTINYSYCDNTSINTGWQASIAIVMEHETGFDASYLQCPDEDYEFSYNNDEDEETVSNPQSGCIMFKNSVAKEFNLARETMLNIISIYGKELGIKEFGDIIFTRIAKDYRKMQQYTITYDKDDKQCEFDDTDNEIMEFVPIENKPKETGLYTVELKDGRRMKCMYLLDKDLWISRHRTWNDMIKMRSKNLTKC